MNIFTLFYNLNEKDDAKNIKKKGISNIDIRFMILPTWRY